MSSECQRPHKKNEKKKKKQQKVVEESKYHKENASRHVLRKFKKEKARFPVKAKLDYEKKDFTFKKGDILWCSLEGVKEDGKEGFYKSDWPVYRVWDQTTIGMVHGSYFDM